MPGLVPEVWSLGSRRNCTVGRSSFATYWSNSRFHSVNRGVPHVADRGVKVSGLSGQARS